MAITLRDQHGRIAPGSGGRTPGSRNKRPGLVDHLPPEAFANIAAKLYQQALSGDVAAAKLLVDRYDPVPRHGRVSLPLPAGDGLEGPRGALAAAPDVALALLDVSEGGVRVRVRGRLRPGDRVLVNVLPPGGAWAAGGPAEVRWCVPADDGTAEAGVRFDRPLSARYVAEVTE